MLVGLAYTACRPLSERRMPVCLWCRRSINISFMHHSLPDACPGFLSIPLVSDVLHLHLFYQLYPQRVIWHMYCFEYCGWKCVLFLISTSVVDVLLDYDGTVCCSIIPVISNCLFFQKNRKLPPKHALDSSLFHMLAQRPLTTHDKALACIALRYEREACAPNLCTKGACMPIYTTAVYCLYIPNQHKN